MAKTKKGELEALVKNGNIISIAKSNNNIAVVVREGKLGINHDAVEIEALLEEEEGKELMIKHISHTKVENDFSGTPTYSVLYESVTVEEEKSSKKTEPVS